MYNSRAVSYSLLILPLCLDVNLKWTNWTVITNKLLIPVQVFIHSWTGRCFFLQWHLCVRLALGPTCRFFPHLHLRQSLLSDSQSQKTEESKDENRKQPSSRPALNPQNSNWLHCASSGAWVATIVACLNMSIYIFIYLFFSSRRWLATLTTHSALFQHIMIWLMCADEQRMLCSAMLSIMYRWAKPRIGQCIVSQGLLIFWLQNNNKRTGWPIKVFTFCCTVHLANTKL